MSYSVAIVTGANRGLGFEACRRLATLGFSVVLTGRDRARAQAAAKTLRDEGLSVRAEVLDVSEDASVEAFAAQVLAELPRVDVLVNNAGAIFEATNDRGDEGSATPLAVSAATVLKSVDNNALGAYRMLQKVLPRMNAAGRGRVVNVSSGMGALTDMGSGWPAYRISKTALNAVTRLFHREAKGDVKINAVCPGWVRTDMGGSSATRSIDEGVEGIIIAATLPADGPAGAFLRDGAVIDW